MRFFDLHCDTVTVCRERGCTVRQNDLHLDLARGAQFDAWGQVFAIWIPDTLRGEAAWSYFEQNYRFYIEQLIPAVPPNCTPVLAVEGGAVLTGSEARLEQLAEMGVRILTLTWNGENELGYGCQTAGGGLKPFGRRVLRRMQALRMIPDVSHLHRDGFYDVLECFDLPVLASHSTSARMLLRLRKPGTDRDFSLRRALDDDQICALRAHGGLVGLNFCGSFLGDPGQDGMQAALSHARHFLELGGEDLLAIGSDFDGCTIHPEMAGIETMSDLSSFFQKNGLDSDICDKIFFRNAWQFLNPVV